MRKMSVIDTPIVKGGCKVFGGALAGCVRLTVKFGWIVNILPTPIT